MSKRILIGITGASGVIYGIEILKELIKKKDFGDPLRYHQKHEKFP